MSKQAKPSMVALLRRIRDQLNEEWADLPWEEILRQLREHAAADPMWQRWKREKREAGSEADGIRAGR